MRADEYIVEKLLKAEQELAKVKEELKVTNNAYTNMQNKTEETMELLDKLKSYCVISNSTDRLTCIKAIYNEDYCSRRTLAYSDEPVFEILSKLLGPLTEEETKDE